MRDPYDVLGLPKNSSTEILNAKYDELRARYSEQRFRDGEEGNEGARLLSELESAWSLIRQDIEKRNFDAQYGNDFGAVDALVKEGNYERAQDILDGMTSRDAQWHYYQAMVFYKKEWLSESRAQLALAVNMEPGNGKYKEALRKLDMVIGNPTVGAQTIGGENRGPYSDGQYQNYNQQQGQNQTSGTGNFLANCCATYCMLELCCSMTRCCSM